MTASVPYECVYITGIYNFSWLSLAADIADPEDMIDSLDAEYFSETVCDDCGV